MNYNKKIYIKEAKMLEEIRELLKLSIEDFVYQMGHFSSKHYSYIKNGRKRSINALKIKTHPTIFKVFNGINNAIVEYPDWKNNATEITAIVIKYLLPTVKKIKQ